MTARGRREVSEHTVLDEGLGEYGEDREELSLIDYQAWELDRRIQFQDISCPGVLTTDQLGARVQADIVTCGDINKLKSVYLKLEEQYDSMWRLKMSSKNFVQPTRAKVFVLQRH